MTETLPSEATVLGVVTYFHKAGNPYHDMKTGRFTFAPGETHHSQHHARKRKHSKHAYEAMTQKEIDGHAAHAMDQYHDEIARGMTPAQAAGWAANSEAESRGNPAKRQIGGPGKGLYQWGSVDSAHDRSATFQNQMKIPIESASASQQRDFRDWELANTEKNAKKHIDSATTVAGKTRAITIFYVRPNHSSLVADDRAKIAEQILKNN